MWGTGWSDNGVMIKVIPIPHYPMNCLTSMIVIIKQYYKDLAHIEMHCTFDIIISILQDT